MLARTLPAIALLALSSCGHKEEPAAKAKAAPQAPIAVSTTRAANTDWQVTREAVGTIRARITATVSARLMAYVRELRVNTGDTVRAGQTLITLDSKDLDTAVRQAEEAQREARSYEAEVESAIRGAKAQLDLAQVTFNRMKDLSEKKSISNQEFDEAQARFRLAQAGHDTAVSKRKQIEAKVAQASEAVKNAGIFRSYTEITAPFSGTVIEKRVEAGSLATPGAPLLILEQAGAYRLEVPVDESLLAGIRRGQRIEVAVDATDKTLAATVGEIVPFADAASRTITVKLDLPPASGLRTGLSGRAQFRLASAKALTIPESAIQPQGSLQLVFTVDRNHARSRLVTLGERRGGQVQILSGLNEGEQVITPIPPLLADGSPVEVR